MKIAPEQAARRDPRRRRRLRHQGRDVSRISAGADGGQAHRAPGELGRRPLRAFPRRRAGPRQSTPPPRWRSTRTAASWPCGSTSWAISAPTCRSSGPTSRGSAPPWRPAPTTSRSSHARCRGIYTNTVPVDAYRGAGRPEAAYVLERLVDNCARELGHGPRRDPGHATSSSRRRCPIRRRPTAPTMSATSRAPCARRLTEADYAGFEARAEAAEAARHGARHRLRQLYRMHRLGRRRGGLGALEPDGTFTVLVGTQSNGQGHATAYAQTVSQYLDVPLERISVVQGDTDRVKTGNGTGGSRSIPVGAAMVSRASETLAAQAQGSRRRQARGRGRRSRDRRRRRADRRHRPRRSLRGDRQAAGRDRGDPDRDRRVHARRPRPIPNGTHVCEVEIDPETGDDRGRALHDLRRLRHDAESRCCWPGRCMAGSRRASARRCWNARSTARTASS